MSNNYLTEKAKKRLQEKRGRIKEKIQEIKQNLGQTKIKRDDTNSQFINGCQSLSRLQEELKRINEILEEGEIVNLGHCEEVKIGAKIILDFGDEEVEYVVGVQDPDCAVLTLDSPLGREILGRKTGEEINYQVRGRECQVRVKDII